MRPDQYGEYSGVFDLASLHGRAFAPGYAFVRHCLQYLNDDARLADLGGGTGLLADHLLFWRSRLRITFVEPGAEMAAIARKRLRNRCEHFLELTFQQACPLPAAPYDALLTARSMYAMEQHRDAYPEVFALMARQLAPGGYLFLLDLTVPSQDSSEEDQNIFRKKMVPEKCTLEEFQHMQDVIKATGEAFRAELDAGRFHLFSREELDALAAGAGFERVDAMPGENLHRLVYRLTGLPAPHRSSDSSQEHAVSR